MKSIRTKLWLGMMVMVGIIVLILWLFQIVFLQKFYSALEINEVIKQANGAITKIKTLDELEQSADAMQTLDRMAYEKQLSVQILDEHGAVTYQTSYSSENAKTPGKLKTVVSQAAANALEGEITKKEVLHPKFGTKFMIIGVPIYIDDTIKGAMLITLPMAAVEDTAGILKKQLIIITTILLLITIGISFYLSKKFSKPIVELGIMAENYMRGNYDMRINRVSDDEIGQLATRMNLMGEELVKNEILQKELIANVSHELRTPLSLIRGYAETLRDVTGNIPEKREKQLGVIIEESERLTSIVEDILSLSQLQAGIVTLNIESFSLMEMLDHIRERYEYSSETRTFLMEGVKELPNNLIGDKRRIEQVFYNLINNAFRHTIETDMVSIHAVSEKDWVLIKIIDTGEGISKEDLQHIFERYYKGKRLDGRKENGTGLGLAIVKSILQMHQVDYGVESKIGEGTTFWFKLKQDNSHTSF